MAATDYIFTDYTLYQKRGDSFYRMVIIPEDIFEDGYFAGWEVKSQIRDAKYQNIISELSCEWDDATTTRVLYIQDLDTKDWLLTDAEMDIQFYNPAKNFTISTDTLAVKIVRDITLPSSNGVVI